VTVAVTAAAYDHGMSATTRPALRLIRGGRTDDDGRQSVDLSRHDTEEVRSVAWTLPRLLAAIRRYRPRRPGDPDWTFSIGRRRSLAIITEGPGTFHARGTVRSADGLVSDVTVGDDLSLREVEALIEVFYAARDDHRPVKRPPTTQIR
jgi:hypothetical protein